MLFVVAGGTKCVVPKSHSEGVATEIEEKMV